MEKITLNVEGMKCHRCENRIINVLGGIEQIKNVRANYENGIVEIDVEGKIDINLVKEKINDLGFSVI